MKKILTTLSILLVILPGCEIHDNIQPSDTPIVSIANGDESYFKETEQIAFSGYRGQDNHNSPLHSYDSLFSLSVSALSQYMSLFGLDFMASFLNYDLTIYKIEYKVPDRENQLITCSGIVSVPVANDSFTVLGLFDGTFTSNDEAPSISLSSYNFSTGNGLLLSTLASAGYIVAIPDGIGFGSSVGEDYSYYKMDQMARNNVNFLRAANALLDELNAISPFLPGSSDELILAGYSKGGYAALATQRRIEQRHSREFNLVKTVCGAGAYDLVDMYDYLLGAESYSDPCFPAFVGLSYSSYDGLEYLLPSMFQEPYDDLIPTLFDGSNTCDEINAELTTELGQLFSVDFSNGYSSDNSVINQFLQKLQRNTIPSKHWKPKAPIELYHGIYDEIVPYDNSVVAYNALVENGATAELIPLEGDHASSAYLLLLNFLIGNSAL